MATKPPVLIRRNTDQAAMARALGNVTPSESPTETAAVAPVATPIPAVKDALGAPAASNDLVVGQTYVLPLYWYQNSENNARVFYSSDELSDMSESLAQKGQDIPAIGYVRDGKVVLVDGQKRFQAATRASLPSLMVLIREAPKDEGAEYEESRRINLERSPQTALDDAVRWQDLIKRRVYESQEDLASRLRLSKATVSKTLGIIRIPERLLRMMSEHRQTGAVSIAYEISCLFQMPGVDLEQATEIAEHVIEQIRDKDLSRKEVVALIKTKLAGKTTRERAESTPVKFGEAKGELKVFAKRGQIELSFSGLPADKVEKLKTRIESMLAEQMSL